MGESTENGGKNYSKIGIKMYQVTRSDGRYLEAPDKDEAVVLMLRAAKTMVTGEEIKVVSPTGKVEYLLRKFDHGGIHISRPSDWVPSSE